ncbi:MAG: asparagine synthase-related protein [Deltaproteobacteria bacterium]|jgi:asparagine synthase (glutamine-hydrolysing)
MCGIVGMFNHSDEQALVAMLSDTVHRGEDNTKYQFFDGRVGLGINRLSIVDLERGDQPLHNETGDVHVVCNGEIYNHQALRMDLSATHELGTGSDAEVISHLYEDHGDDCVKLLDGMYAFVLYDQNRGRFLAARDALGIKPLYYAREGERWYFASEAKALLAAGVEPQTVRSLPPGYRLTERGPEQYYYRASHKSFPNPKMVRTLLDHAVQKRMTVADVEVGTFLSGGLDSSLVTAIAAQYNPNLQAFTVGMEGRPDVIAARKLGEHLGIRHHVRTFTVDEMFDLLPEAIWHVESYNPSMVTGSVVTLMAARFAKDMGIKVVLCGEGSDEIFAGYKALRNMPWPELEQATWTLIQNLHKTELQRLDRMSMAVSLEARVPFMDRDLVEYALNLPAEVKIKEVDGRLVEKYILREAFEDLLPHDLLWREKMPFDQGSGGRSIIEVVNGRVTDDEFEAAKREHPEAQLVSKEAYYYFKIWREHFGEMGGRRVFDMFGDYPVMMDGIKRRTAESGS